MPWKIQKRGSQFAVVKKTGGHTLGVHPSKAAAVKQMRALHANEGRKGEK
jgi:hypothetical protein